MTALRPALVLAALLALGCSSEQREAKPALGVADRIYVNGPVLTVDAGNDVAQALAVAGGRIAAVGSRDEVLAWQGPDTEVVDLAGRALAPGFIDAHGHLTQVARLAAAVNVASPPVGPVTSIPELQSALRQAIESKGIPSGTWVIGAGYDDALLAEHRHPGRADLDAVSLEHPIALLHVSLHLAALNSAALALAGIGPSTPDPPGGRIRRVAGSREPNGGLEESALFLLLKVLPTPDLEQSLVLLDRAQQLYASHGLTTAQDGATMPSDWELLRAAADRDRLVIDVVAYPLSPDGDAILEGDFPLREYQGRLKLGGAKLLLDGSPQGKTAWLTEPYFVPPPGEGPDYRGYPALPDDVVEQRISDYASRGIQVLAHANGDAAADQMIRAVAAAQSALPPGERIADQRPVMVHAQTVREDQLDRMQELGIVPSFFESHVFYWGDWHRDSVLGPERAARISPAASALRRKMHFTLHNDAPVVPPDVLRLISAAVNRTTRSGAVLGPDQRIPPAAALRAVTYDAAWQNFEEDQKGSLEPGKLADLVILSANPLTVDPTKLTDIEVVETIKEGKTIYRR
jgi:predicted amidohydrolase YtcJ